MILRRQQRKTHPAGAARINRNDILGRTITHCLPLNGYDREIVTGAQVTYGAGGSFAYDAKGGSLRGNGTAACASVPIDLSPYTKVSVSFWMYWDAYANDDDFAMEYGSNQTANSGFMIDPNSGAPASGLFQISMGSPGVNNAGSIARPTAAAWHHYAINFDRATGVTIGVAAWVDSVSQAVTSIVAGDVVDNFGNNSLYLFSRNNASLFGAGRMQNLVIRGGYLMTALEAKLEFMEPWRIFRPLDRKLFVGTSAPGGGATGDYFGKNALGENAFGSKFAFGR